MFDEKWLELELPVAYSYDEETGLFAGEQQCTLDVLESELQGRPIFALPGNCTDKKPPVNLSAYHKAKWNGEDWTVVEDYRDTEFYFYDDNGNVLSDKMQDIGPLPAGASLEPLPYNPTEAVLFANLRAARDVRLVEYDNNISQLERELRANPDAVEFINKIIVK